MDVEVKTVFLIIPELGMGGAQRSLAKLSVELSKAYKVYLIVFNTDYSIPYPVGGTLISLDITAGKTFFDKGMQLYKRVKRLKKLKRLYSPIASISFLEGADFINILTKSKDRVIVSVRGSKLYDETIQGRFKWLRLKVLIPILYNKADYIVSVNNGIRNELLESYNFNSKKLKVINNFYNIEEIQKKANETLDIKLISYLEGKKIIAMSGRYAVEKGQKYVIQLLAELKESVKNVVLLLIGDGPEFDDLKHVCAQNQLKFSDYPILDIGADVLFIRKELNVFKIIKKADLYVLCSSSEGFPNGIAEAMICGVPIIASDCPYGPRELLVNDTGKHNVEFGILLPVFQNCLTKEEYSSCLKIWVNTTRSMLENDQLNEFYKKRGLERASVFTKENALLQWKSLIGKK